MDSSIDSKIAQINQRFKLAQLGLQIECRGQKLGLRGTLPPRPGSDRLKPHQQRLSLGFPANATGLKQAEQEVKVIAGQLIENRFDWRNYVDGVGWGRLDQLGLTQQIRAFERYFKQDPKRSGNPTSTQTTWDFAYAPYLRKLEAIAEANPSLSLVEAIYATVRTTEVNSRSRQVCCTALTAFTGFIQLALPEDLKNYWGSYGTTHTQVRELPPDDLILQTWAAIPNPHWQYVYGIMATYGLRNHEVFFSDYSALQNDSEPTIQVLSTTKTGSHEVWPFHPEWIERFNLRAGTLPPIQTDLTKTTLQRVGQLVSVQFRRYNLPFSPYDLRHAWAVRTIHIGLPDTVAARMMGHSVGVHTRTYHQWMTRRDQQQAVDTALARRR